MRIEHIRIENYKGFRDTGQIPIGARFTVVAGQNNSGKTAFLEVMRAGSLTDKPYRRPQQIEEVLPPLFKPKSSIVFGISVSGPELERFLILSGSSVNVPVFENAPAKVQSQIENYSRIQVCSSRLGTSPIVGKICLHQFVFPIAIRTSSR